MTRQLIAVLTIAALAGCGMGETAATAAAVGTGKAKEAEQAENTMQRAEQQLDAANQLATDRLKAADQ